VLPTNESADMDGDENMEEIIALADLAAKGLQNNGAAETGNNGDNENLEDEEALAELEAAEKPA
ncbi:hypothetical protein MKW92_008339, partial [Papaver armeniacum]